MEYNYFQPFCHVLELSWCQCMADCNFVAENIYLVSARLQNSACTSFSVYTVEFNVCAIIAHVIFKCLPHSESCVCIPVHAFIYSCGWQMNTCY